MPFDPSALLKDFDSDKIEALIETMVLAADADGDFSQEEHAELSAAIQRLVRGTRQAAVLSGDRLNQIIQSRRALIASEGRKQRILAVRRSLDDLDARMAALGLAILVTNADGIVRTSERELIMALAEGLEIDPDVAADMVGKITRPPPAPGAPPHHSNG